MWNRGSGVGLTPLKVSFPGMSGVPLVFSLTVNRTVPRAPRGGIVTAVFPAPTTTGLTTTSSRSAAETRSS